MIKQVSSPIGSETDALVFPPARRGANALMRLLQSRRSSREFADRPLDPQTLADLLWSANGESTPDGYRTAPSARNWREIDVYVALAHGLYRYDAHTEGLVLVVREDIRGFTGQQGYVGAAPVNLVYVADFEKMGGASQHEREFNAPANAGATCQNVYLFCAAAGLATVVRGLIDRPDLARRMRLRPLQRVILAQSVGYPA